MPSAAMALGAYDFYQKPIDAEMLSLIVGARLPRPRARGGEPARFSRAGRPRASRAS